MADETRSISKDKVKDDDTGSVDSGRMSRREVVAYDSEDDCSRSGEPGTVTNEILVENADEHHQISDVRIVARRGSPEEADDANKGQSSASFGSEQRSMTGCESDTEYERLSRLQSAGKVSNVFSDGKRILSAGGGMIPLDSGYRDSVSFRSTSAESRNRPEFISVAVSEEPVNREINSASSDNTGTAECDVTSLRSQQGLTVEETADGGGSQEPTKPVIMSSSTTSINSTSSSSRTTDKLKSKIENANLLLPNNSIDLVQNKTETRIQHSSMDSRKDNADVQLDTGATKSTLNSTSSQRSSASEGGNSNATDTIPSSRKTPIANNDIVDAENKEPQPAAMAKKVKRKRQISASTSEHQASPYFPARPPRPTPETSHPPDGGGPAATGTASSTSSAKPAEKNKQKQKGLHDVTKRAYNQPLSGLSSERGKSKQIKGRNGSAPRKARSASESSKDGDGGQQSSTLANLNPSRTASIVSLQKKKDVNPSDTQQPDNADQTKQAKSCESVSVNSSTASIKSSIFLSDIYRELKTFIDVVDNEESSKGHTNPEQPKKSERFQARRQGLESMLESIGSYSTKIGSIISKLNDCMQELRTQIREELSANKDPTTDEAPSVANSATSIKSAVGNSIIDLTHSLESAVEAEVAEDRKLENEKNGVDATAADINEISKANESQDVDNNQKQELDDEAKVPSDMDDALDDNTPEKVDVSDEGAHKGDTAEEENIKENDFQRQAGFDHQSSTVKSEHIYTIPWMEGRDAIGCIVRLKPGSMDTSSIQFECLDPVNIPPPVGEHETLLSHIIKLTFEEKELKPKCTANIAIPYHSEEVLHWREAVLKELREDGQWTVVPGRESVFHGMINSEIATYEADIKGSRTLAVVARPVIDKFVLSKDGGSVESSTDGRVSISAPENTFEDKEQLTLMVRPLESSLISEFRGQEEDNDILLAASPMIEFEFQHEPSRPVYVTTPCRRVSGRPKTGGSGYTSTNSRSTSASDSNDDAQYHLIQYGGPKGTHTRYVDFSSIDSDRVSFVSHDACGRFIVVRLRKGERYQTIETVAKSFREFVIEKPLILTAMQDPKHLSDIRFQCLVKSRMSPSMRYLTTRRSPNFFSQHVRLREGQALEIRFRGNLTASDGGSRSFVYYYLHSIQTEMKVKVVDQYAQRTLATYCGFLQIFTPRVKPIADPLYPHIKYKNMSLLGEFCLGLPRANLHPFQPILKSPLEIKLEGSLDSEVLHYLANQLVDDWKLVISAFGVPRPRVQSLLRNNGNEKNSDFIHDILVYWIRKIPRLIDKAELLSNALQRCNRDDLAKTILLRDRAYKEKVIQLAKELTLNKAIASVCKSQSVVERWADLGRRLCVTNDALNTIESNHEGDILKCYHMLKAWQAAGGDAPMLTNMQEALREMGFQSVADFINTNFVKR